MQDRIDTLLQWFSIDIILDQRARSIRQFVASRVKRIQEHDSNWHYFPSVENPADIGSGGVSTVVTKLWKNGLKWLSDAQR